jgi:putative CocE/NonD family hydrolase
MASQLGRARLRGRDSDTRGRYASEGEFYPFRNESQDGFDTVEWAAKLPVERASRDVRRLRTGATQMLAAIAKPPHLEAIFPYVTSAEYYEGWTYQGGSLMQWFDSSWSSGLALDTLTRQAGRRLNPKEWSKTLPVESYRMADFPPVDGLAPYFKDWVAHERDDDYWRPWKISDHYPEMKVKRCTPAAGTIFSWAARFETMRACASRRRPLRIRDYC